MFESKNIFSGERYRVVLLSPNAFVHMIHWYRSIFFLIDFIPNHDIIIWWKISRQNFILSYLFILNLFMYILYIFYYWHMTLCVLPETIELNSEHIYSNISLNQNTLYQFLFYVTYHSNSWHYQILLQCSIQHHFHKLWIQYFKS